jgi:photoactive yellow protein
LITIEESVLTIDEAELASFPHGIIRLDASGKILYYNDAAALLSGIPAKKNRWLNFSEDVAPCTAVKNFQGRFNEFVATSGSRIEQFAFLFRYIRGDKQVRITFVRRAGDEQRIFIVVNATTVAPQSSSSERTTTTTTTAVTTLEVCCRAESGSATKPSVLASPRSTSGIVVAEIKLAAA